MANKETHSSGAPIQPSSKGAKAEPQVNSDVELGNLANGNGAGPDMDIMQIARTGDIPAMEKLFESKEYDATYSDDQGITALHWAAINNQYAMCKFLIEKGAEINKKGGESVATPLQWAAQRCHYYTVHLLLQHGADPLITDAQGYNTLHISTFNGNVLLLTLLLHTGIPVDVLDSYGHTGLMWASYKGFPACVDVYLRWGASVHARDEQGFTALHWALVKGSPGCIQKLIEYGADRFAKTDTGKTPATTAEELKTLAAWHKALKECGYDEDGHLITPSFPGASYMLKDRRGFVTKFTYLWPLLIVWSMMAILAGMPVFAGVPIALATAYTLQEAAKRVLTYAPPDMRQFQRTPWMAGIFSASLFLVGLNWFFRVMPATTFRADGETRHLFLNLCFGGFIGLCAWFYYCCMVFDPGFVPKINGIAQQKAVIDELISLWKYDEANFCVQCMIRTPLRSKHCRRCQRCVARHDHHCPWVYNCVGVNNHRHFFLYLVNLTLSIFVLDGVLYYYYTAAMATASEDCNIFGPVVCKIINTDTYTLLLSIWANLQLTWVGMLLFVQFIQVARAMTTYENMFGVNNVGASSLTSAFTSTGAPLDPNHPEAMPPSGAAAQPDAVGHGHHGHSHGGGGFIKSMSKLLGVDAFIETATGRGAAAGGKNKKRKGKNPYSRGCVTNCKDFWCDSAPMFGPRENGTAMFNGHVVNYAEMYESPALMQFAGRGRDRRGAYEAVGGEEV
ncbi:Palmitoyltransferase akr1 [Cytospora mali]|uniref:Palmitoyltransferase n=1 Tax=Cytospora mali TaxID=578113 RepID=A0A194VKX3_CYTMA|nr:Palmitoyltransferase akr1 [Valsa mali]